MVGINSNFIKRVVTSCIALLAAWYFFILSNDFFKIVFLAVLQLFCIYEIYSIIFYNKRTKKTIKSVLILIIACLYAFLGFLSLYKLFSFFSNLSLFFILASVWVFDSGAYIIGTLVNGPKLVPKISPKKTWSGLIGGGIIVMFYYFCLEYYRNRLELDFRWFNEGFFILIALVGQLGDILESYFKRIFQVKDSGSILPGHGGFLDRLDSAFLASIFIYISLLL